MKEKDTVQYDWGLLWLYMFLMGLGLINLLSASSSSAKGGLLLAINNPSYYFKMQAAYMLLGIIIMIIITRLDYRIFERMAYPIYLITLVLLVLVLIVGNDVSGSTRWIPIGSFRLQPSELGKIALVLALAKFFHNDKHRGNYGLQNLLFPFLIVGIPLVLLYFEPDLGTALFYTMVAISLILFAGVKGKHIAILLVLGIGIGLLSYFFLLHEYQQARILTFLNPQLDPLGKGYHTIQSQIAVGSGKFFGKGYLAGSQSQLKFLPEQHTDFIFSVLAEEWGFLGCFVLLFLYFGLLMKGINIGSRAKEKFGAYLAIGVVCVFFWQIVVNLGGVLGLLPITGITLPFLSYGGSSVLTLSIAIGFLQSISVRRFMF